MSSFTNRSEKYNKLYKVAKRHYQPVFPPANRTVLEHMVYACCLEDSPYEAADEVFAKLLENYYDWNEIRVTTALELSEVMKELYDPLAAANRLRKALHSLFETKYSFDADYLKKENLGKAIDQLAKFKGLSPFGIATVTQLALGGHSIPADQAALNLMYLIGAISKEEMAEGKIPGLERTIPKNKGAEYGSVVHQLAAAFIRSPFDKGLRDIILQIDSAAVDRFPKRGGGRKRESEVATPEQRKRVGANVDTKRIDKAKKGPDKQPTKTPTKKDIKSNQSKQPRGRPSPVADNVPPKKKSATKTLAKKKPR